VFLIVDPISLSVFFGWGLSDSYIYLIGCCTSFSWAKKAQQPPKIYVLIDFKL
jgi:hypothetical protein